MVGTPGDRRKCAGLNADVGNHEPVLGADGDGKGIWKTAMKKFLKYEMNNYLQGRATEGKKELPLMLCENQQYIHYNKGSVIMYALRDYIGEDTLNAALAKYIKAVAYQEPPYTNS